MLNYESVGGVNFKKGCYPGQEVVARSQFRGTLKRRAYLAHARDALQAGQEIFHEADPSQPCGLVAQAAAAPDGGWDAIVSIQIAASAGRALDAAAARKARPSRCSRRPTPCWPTSEAPPAPPARPAKPSLRRSTPAECVTAAPGRSPSGASASACCEGGQRLVRVLQRRCRTWSPSCR